MKKITKNIDNEQGFVLVASLMMLLVLTIIGIAATNTTTMELQISGNDKLAKQTFYQAEAMLAEGVQGIINDKNDLVKLATYPRMDPTGTGILTTGSGGTEALDVHIDNTWTGNNSLTPLPSMPGAENMIAYRGVVKGSSLEVSDVSIHGYDVYGRSLQNNALSIVKTGFLIPLKK